MPTLINRGSRSAAASPEYFRQREQRREQRAEYRRTHRHIGWVCPFCEHHQILEYPTQERRAGHDLPQKTRWMETGAIETRCANIVRDRSGKVVADCGLLSRVSLSKEQGNPEALSWLYWSDAKFEHEALQDRREAIADGYRAAPEDWERGAGLLVPKFAVPPPAFVQLNALNGIFGVVPLEARENSTMSLVTLWLPNGHLKVPVVTDYKENGIHYVELNVPLPFQQQLRDDLLLLIDAQHRAEHDASNKNVYLRSPYGTGPYCWTGRLRTQATVEEIPDEVTDKLSGEIPEEIPKGDSLLGQDSWFDIDEDLTQDVPWSAVEAYLETQG